MGDQEGVSGERELLPPREEQLEEFRACMDDLIAAERARIQMGETGQSGDLSNILGNYDRRELTRADAAFWKKVAGGAVNREDVEEYRNPIIKEFAELREKKLIPEDLDFPHTVRGAVMGYWINKATPIIMRQESERIRKKLKEQGS